MKPTAVEDRSSTEEDDWTPWIGWRKAMITLPVRLASALAPTFGLFWLLYLLIGAMEAQVQVKIDMVQTGLIVVFAMPAGGLASVAMSRRLIDTTGLPGTHLVLPVCLVLLAGLAGLFWLTIAITPRFCVTAGVMYTLTAFFSCTLSAKRLISDS